MFSAIKRTKNFNVEKTTERKLNRYVKRNHNEFVFFKRKEL